MTSNWPFPYGERSGSQWHNGSLALDSVASSNAGARNVLGMTASSPTFHWEDRRLNEFSSVHVPVHDHLPSQTDQQEYISSPATWTQTPLYLPNKRSSSTQGPRLSSFDIASGTNENPSPSVLTAVDDWAPNSHVRNSLPSSSPVSNLPAVGQPSLNTEALESWSFDPQAPSVEAILWGFRHEHHAHSAPTVATAKDSGKAEHYQNFELDAAPHSPLPSLAADFGKLGSHLSNSGPPCDFCRKSHALSAQGQDLRFFEHDVDSILEGTDVRKRKRGEAVPLENSNKPKSLVRDGCPKCRMQHKQCVRPDDDAPCVRCFKDRVRTCLCSRDRLSEITLYGTEAGPVAARQFQCRRWVWDKYLGDKSETSEGQTITVKLNQNYGVSMSLEVCALAIPAEEVVDMVDSEKRFFAHRYKLANPEKAAADAQEFVKQSVGKCIKFKVPDEDVMTQAIFKVATQLAQKHWNSDPQSTFLGELLHFWTAGRLIEGGFGFDEPEVLGLPPGARLSDAPVLDEQFAVLLVDDVLEPLRKKVVKELDNIITHQRKERWFPLVLAMFILLHHYSLAMIHQWEFSRRSNCEKRYTSKEFLQRLHQGARCLLVHFHTVCGGRRPFDKPWQDGKPQKERSAQLRDKLRKIAPNLQNGEERFMLYLIDHLHTRMPEFQYLSKTHNWEDPHWFVGQLFLADWKPIPIPDDNELPNPTSPTNNAG